MAQGTQTPPGKDQKPKGKNSFHYYSGGEVKELASAKVSSWLWITYGIVIAAGLFYFFYGGALGPHFGGFKPTGGSQETQNRLSNELNAQAGAQLATLDLTRLPIPNGQTLTQSIENGSEIYQNYCIGCHGPNQDGNGVNAASLNPKPRNLRDAPFMQAMSYQRISTSLHKGVYGTAMPRWENTLSESQIQEIITYVFSLTSPAPGAGSTPAMGGAPGGANEYAGGVQNSPKPINPPVNGNPTAPTATAPPSLSGPPPGTDPLAGGRSAAPPLQPAPAAPAPAGNGPTPTSGVGTPAPGR